MRGPDRLFLGTLALALAAAALLRTGEAQASSVLLLLAVAGLPYGALVHRGATLPARGLHALTLGLGLLFVAGDPLLSDDVYRYLWDARVLWHTGDPYTFAPDDGALAPLRDGLWRKVNHPQIPTIYPPIAQGFFLVADRLAHGSWAMQLLALSAHIGIAEALRRAHGAGAAFAWGLNPLAIVESASSAHVDVFVGGAVLAFGWQLRQGRALRAALWAGAASGLKLLGLALAPLLARSPRAFLLAAALGAIAIAPLLGAGEGSDAVPGLGHYAQRWQGNAGAFPLLEAGARALLLEVAETPAEGRVRLDGLRPLFESLDGSPLDPRAAFRQPKKPIHDIAEFDLGILAGSLARLAALALVGVVVLVQLRRRRDGLAATRAVVLAALVCAPQVHPWYLVWLLPCDIALGRRTAITWSCVAWVAYAPLSGWFALREWHEVAWAHTFEYTVVLLAWMLEHGDPTRPVARGSEPVRETCSALTEGGGEAR